MLRMLWGPPSRASSGMLAGLSPDERNVRLRNAAKALEMIMNEDFSSADTVLSAHDDAFHKTGRAVKFVIDALLTFDKEDIKQSATQLEEALVVCEAELAHVKALPGSVFPDGAEFSVIIALVLLQLALTGFLSESIPEAMKAVWKMKRCYNIFYNLNKHMQTHKITVKARGEPREMQDRKAGESLLRITTFQLKLAGGLGSELSETDYFVACATVAGHGLLSLIISIIPPTIARILSVVGFRGNKVQALEDLWSAAEAPNIYGAIALLGLLGYFGIIVGFSDILGNEEVNMRRLCVLLNDTVARYPNSSIFKLQSARMQQQLGNTADGISILHTISPGPHMKQLEVLKYQDMGFAYLVVGQWEEAAECLIKVESMNDWSKSLLNYVIGSCLTEQYRESGISTYAEKATKHFYSCDAELFKKKIMGKALAFETYFKRKILRWKSRSKTNVLVDGMTVSPVMELCHLFNSWKKMDPDRCSKSLKAVQQTGAVPDTLDDRMLRNLMSCALKRRLQDWAAFENISQASCVTRKDIKMIPHAETWAIPWTYYEYAACLWTRDGHNATPAIREWLERAKTFGDTEMESRLAARLVTAFETIDAM